MSHRAAWFAAVLVAGLLVAGGFDGVTEVAAARVSAAQDANRDRDADFVKGAVDSGRKAIDAGKVAMTKASVPEVRAFAERVVKFYTTSTAELMSMAQTPPPPQDADVKAAAKAGLETQTDATFDRTYIAQAVTDHDATVRLYEQEAGEGKDERLKLWASQKLPVIREHLEAARALGAKLASSAVR